MKICPNCQRTYADDGLNFCLDDGAILSQTGSSVPPTVFNQPHPTSKTPTQQSWDNPAPYTMQPKLKSSKTWLWAVGILGAAVLLCGGGFVGFVAWVGSLNTNTNSKNVSNAIIANRNPNVNFNSSVPKIDERTNVQKVDLSAWAIAATDFGTTEYNNGTFLMASSKKGFYYVIAGMNKHKTEEATVKLTVKNGDQADSNLGYGLVVHSDTTPLKQDYAFLIDSVKRRYRVVYHQPGKEIAAVAWTNSTAIRAGAGENNLEVRDANGKMDFYINGSLITSVRNLYGYKGGVVGLYSGDAVKIAFSNLEIRK